MRITITALALLMLSLGGMAAAADSDQPVSPEARRQAQKLASESLECLRRGEDATAAGEKMVAYQRGLEAAERALALDDQNPDAHFGIFGNRGRILLLEGTVPNPINLLKANRDLERALEIDPNHTDALAAKGGLYRQLPWALGGSLAVAETCLTRAIALDPEAVSARIELAATYRDMGQPERGVELLKTAESIAVRQGKERQLREARDLMRELGPCGTDP